MKLKPTLVAILLLLTVKVRSQEKMEFPINPNTGLISVSNVIEVKGKSRPVLREMALSFVSSNKTIEYRENSSNYRKKMKEVPKFWAIPFLDSDSLLVFDAEMQIFVEAKLMSDDIGASNNDYLNFKLYFYLKDGKVKYELTNFVHKRFPSNEGGGGKFENESPDWKELSGKKRWKLYKEAGLIRAKLLAEQIEKYFSSEHSSQFNF